MVRISESHLWCVHMHDPFFRTNKESSIWHQNYLSVSFIFQGDCRMKIEHVLFASVFFKITDPFDGRSF